MLVYGYDYLTRGRQEVGQLRQELEATRRYVSAEVEQGKIITEFIEPMIAQFGQWFMDLSPVDQAQMREMFHGVDLIEWGLKYQQQGPALMERSRADALQRQLDAMQQGHRAAPPDRGHDPQAEMATLAASTLAETVGEVRTALPDLAGLTDADVQAIQQALGDEDPLAFFRYPTEDEVLREGLDPRAPVLDGARLEKFVRREARALLGPREAAAKAKADALAEQKRKADLAKQNERRLANATPGGGNAPPPSTAPAVGSTAPGGRKFASREEYLRHREKTFGG
jgi:hypothetical protein